MKKKILFLCTGNSCRSQMAEGWCRHLWNEQYESYSAGTRKHGLNVRAVKVMAEVGLDISNHFSKTIEELPNVQFDYVVTVCDAAKERCPYFPAEKIIHLGFEDPPDITKNFTNETEIIAIYRKVRDEIFDSIKKLPALLGEQ